MLTTNSNNLQIFNSEEFGQVEVIVINGEPFIELYSVGQALGYVKIDIKNGKEYKRIRVDRIDTIVENTEIEPFAHGGRKYLSEVMLYDFMLESKTSKCKSFKKWITHVVLPTINKTGGYIANEENFIDTYLPFADEPTKLLFKSTLAVITNQNGIISKQKSDIDYKSGVIQGLTEDIPLASKRQILNRVVMKCSNFNDRWKELYFNFEQKYHLKINARMESYNKTHKSKLRSKLEYIEEIGMIDELYSIACKLYESEVNILVQEMYELHKVEQ